jgi:nucleoside triphosphate diphosphatase
MKEFDRLNKTIKKLRAPRGCPWDRDQTPESMKQYLLEEAYELSDAIGKDTPDAIMEELGDIFLILIVLTHMYNEKQLFDLKGVLESVNEKLIKRHPHVFSTKKLSTKKEVLDYWIKSKAKDKKRRTIRCRLPVSAPALTLAAILNKEIAHVAKDKHSDSPTEIIGRINKATAKLNKKQAEREAFSSILFDFCRLAFTLGVDLEGALREKVVKEAENIPYSDSKK